MHALISLRPRNFISNHASTVASAAASTKAPSSTISKTPHFARFSHVNQSFLQSNSHNSQMKSLNTASDKSEHVIILGGGIAGLSTARYLLSNTQQNKNLKITLIDKNIGTSLKQHSTPTVPSIPSTYESYIQGQIDVSHFNIPSRRNGNMLCPSLTTPWTSRSLWNEAFLPVLKSFIPSYTSSNNAKSDVHPPSITFDWASMALDKNMVRCFFNNEIPFGNNYRRPHKIIICLFNSGLSACTCSFKNCCSVAPNINPTNPS